MFHLRSAAVEMYDAGLVREDAVVVAREGLLQLLLAVVGVGGEVLHGALQVVLAGKDVEQRRSLEAEESEPVLVPQCEGELELLYNSRYLNIT